MLFTQKKAQTTSHPNTQKEDELAFHHSFFIFFLKWAKGGYSFVRLDDCM
jgi:hypothetical protein